MDVAAANRVLTTFLAEKVLNHHLEPAKAVLSIAWLYDWDHQGPAKEFVVLNYAYEELYEKSFSTRDAELDRQTRGACVSFLATNLPQNAPW